MGLKTTEVPKISQNRQGDQGELVSPLGEPHPAQCMSCMVIKQKKSPAPAVTLGATSAGGCLVPPLMAELCRR